MSSSFYRRAMEKNRDKLYRLSSDLGIPCFAPKTKYPVIRRAPRPSWESNLAETMRPHTLAALFEWPGPEDVSRLKRQGGNPYFDFWKAVDGNEGGWCSRPRPTAFSDMEKLRSIFQFCSDDEMAVSTATHMSRDYGVLFYGWAIPDEAALQAIAELGQPILDLGSGRGYWAWQLEQRGVRMLCAEQPDHGYQWFWRAPDRSRQRSLPKNHALFFCWPSYQENWPVRQLRAYQGDTVIYVGEHGGCTAEDRFHQTLDEQWKCIKTVPIPTWDAIHDVLRIYRRGKRR